MKLKIFSLLFFLTVGARAQESAIDSVKYFLLNEDYNSAIITSNSALEKSPEATLYYLRGIANSNLFNFSDALKDFESAAAQDTNSIKYKIAVGNAYKNLGFDRKATEAYESAFKKDSSNLTAAEKLGASYSDMNRFREALSVFNFLAGKDSNKFYYFKRLGNLYSKISIDSLAAINFERSVKMNKIDFDSHLQLALIYFRMQKFDSSLTSAFNAYKLNQADPRPSRLMAENYLKKEQHENALQFFKYALEKGDSSAATFQKAGVASYMAGFNSNSNDLDYINQFHEEAVTLLGESIKIKKDDPMTALYMGLAYKELTKYDSALIFLDKTLALLTPEYLPDIYVHLGQSNEQMGNYSQAVKDFQKALELKPGNDKIYYYIAAVLDKGLNDRKNSLKYYEKFIDAQKDKKNFFAQYAEERIEKLKEEIFFRQE